MLYCFPKLWEQSMLLPKLWEQSMLSPKANGANDAVDYGSMLCCFTLQSNERSHCMKAGPSEMQRTVLYNRAVAQPLANYHS